MVNVGAIIGTIVGLMVAGIIAVNFIEPLQTAITTANQTGTIGTILDLLPMLLVVVILMVFVGAMYLSRR